MRKVDTGTLAQRIGQSDSQSSLQHGFEVLDCSGNTGNFALKHPTFEGSSFHIFMGKGNKNIDFIYLVVSAPKS